MMEKLHKATIYFTGLNRNYNETDEEFWDDFSRVMERMEAIPHVFEKESAPINWHDDIDINKRGCTQEDYEKYFKVNPMTKDEIEKALGYRVEIVDGVK
jgi:hypothetical protein